MSLSAGSSPLAEPKIELPLFLVRSSSCSHFPLFVAKPLGQGFLWAGTAVSLSFLVFRLAVKIRSYHRIYSDDYLVIGAWILLLASALLWQMESPNLYELFNVASGQKPLTKIFVKNNTALLRSLTPFALLFYSCLWIVKLSFLLFFRRLGMNVRGQKIWWWCVLAVVLLTWAATIADNDYKCSLKPIEYIWCQFTPAFCVLN